MKLILAICMAIAAISLVAETETAKTFRKGIVGVYGRMDGIVYYSVTLQRDGIYIFTQSDCLTSFSEKGKWTIKDDVVVFDREVKGFRRFRIYPIEKRADLALLPLDERSVRDGEKEEVRLFLPHEEKKGQSPLP